MTDVSEAIDLGPDLPLQVEGNDPWMLVFDGYEPADEGVREALCVTGNGYMATRGALPESFADGVHYPGTYLAGVYNRLTSVVRGVPREDESLVNAPNWLYLRFRTEGGPWFAIADAEVLEHRHALDLRRGILIRRLRFRDEAGRCTAVVQRRLVHMGSPHLAALQTVFVAENWSGTLEIRSGLDARVENRGVAEYASLAARHLTVLSADAYDETVEQETETNQSHVRIAQAARTRVPIQSGDPIPARTVIEKPGLIAHQLAVVLPEGQPVSVEKVVATHTSRDRAISECSVAARSAVAGAPDFADMVRDHAGAWKRLWARCELEMGETATASSLVLNLHVFHLLQSASPHLVNLDASVGARGLHGEGYRGHVFWDELFVFPFLNFRFPDLTRSLLLYRYRRLDEARRAAREAGLAGAMYPWQSGSDGREETPPALFNVHSGRWLPDHSRLQRHVGLAVAYNVWHYYEVTGDVAFLRSHGAELLVEIARFIVSIAEYDPALARYRIRGVMGPDEFHDGYPDALQPGLDDNTYTNVLAAWTLARTLDVVQLLAGHHSEDLWDQLNLQASELELWDEISRKLRVVFHADGIPSQFDGYEDLEELDLSKFEDRDKHRGRIDLFLEQVDDTPNRYKASKQADVLMLFYLLSADQLVGVFERLGYTFAPETIPAAADYYLPRTTHASTLSRVVHSWVLARADRSRSWDLFLEALASDVNDMQGGTTAEGIHLGAMAGTIDLLQRCFTGLEIREDALWFNPQLPDELGSLRFEMGYRGQWLRIYVDASVLRVTARPSAARPVRVTVRDNTVELGAGETREFPLDQT